MEKIKAILFDHDGTLVDSEPIHCKLWRGILNRYDLDLSLEEYIKYFAGIPSTGNAQRILEQNPSLAVSPSALVEAKTEATLNYLSQDSFPLMPGARHAIEHFSALGLKLGVVTGAGPEGITATLKYQQLGHYFNTVVSAEDVTHSKPAPDCYLLAAQKLGVDPQQCIAIEDTENGVAAAVKANIPCVAVYSVMTQHHDFSHASVVFDNLNDAQTWIAQHYLQPV